MQIQVKGVSRHVFWNWVYCWFDRGLIDDYEHWEHQLPTLLLNPKSVLHESS